MNKFYGSHSTTNLRKRIEFPESLKTVISNNKIKQRKSFNKDIYNININNFNINTRRDLIKSYSNKTIELVTGFKKVLEQTENIKQKIFNNNSSHFFSTINKNDYLNEKNRRKTKMNKNNIITKSFNDFLNPNKKYNLIKLGCKANNSFKYYPISIKNSYNSIIYDENKKFKTPTINQNISYKIDLNTNFIEQENNDLKKESEFLLNENNFLSSKLNEYKIKSKNNLFENKKDINFYNKKNSKVIINSIKASLNYNVNNNLEIAKRIIKALKQIQKLEKEINMKIKQEKRRNLVKKQYEENNKRFNELTKEKEALDFELKKLKIYLEELKTKEKILSFKYESELNSKKNQIDSISKLESTIEKMNKSREEILKNKFNSIKNLKLNSNPNKKYSNKINQLKLIHKYLENKKNILIKENKILRKGKNYKNEMNKNNKIGELKGILNELKKKNIENKLKLEEKDNQIIMLKFLINKYSNTLKDKNTEDNIFKLDINELIKEDYNAKENNNNLIIKNKITNLINKRNYYQNLKNLKEMNYIKTCKYLIKQKDLEISNLKQKINNKNGILKIIEDKVKPLYKKNNTNNTNTISKASSYFNSINNNSHIKKEKNNFNRNTDWKNKQENSFDKIRKRKSKILYMNNIDNNFKKNIDNNHQ